MNIAYSGFCIALGVYFGPNRMYARSIAPILLRVLISGEFNSMAAAALSRSGDEDDADDDCDDMMLDDRAVYRNDLAVQSGSNGKLTSLQQRGDGVGRQ